MFWQDYIFTAGSIIFIIALLPSVFSKDKPALSTSLMTGTVLAIFAFNYTTLSLWFSATSTALTSATWFFLAVQKYSADKKG